MFRNRRVWLFMAFLLEQIYPNYIQRKVKKREFEPSFVGSIFQADWMIGEEKNCLFFNDFSFLRDDNTNIQFLCHNFQILVQYYEMQRRTLFIESLDSSIRQPQDVQLQEIQPQPPNKQKETQIKVKLPNYERFSKISPQRIRTGSAKDSLVEKQETQIQVSPAFAWLLLLLNVVCNALVPCWLMFYLDKQAHTRNSWRFFVLSILTLPFVAFQKRRIAQVGGNIFDLINKDFLKNNFIASINFCIEILFVIQAFRLTSLTHSVTLVSLKYYIISLMKVSRNQKIHQFSKAGIMLVSVAVLCQLSDNFNQQSQIINGFYGILGDIVALGGSVISALIHQNYQVPNQPKFLNLFFRNLFISFNFICFGYYFGGSQLSFNEYYGVYALFMQQNFVNIFYVAIMLGLSLMISSVLLPDIFSFFIRDIANSFTPALSSFFYRILALQSSSSSYTYISFGFLIPGLMLILTGQNVLKNGEIKIDFVVYRPQRQQKKQEDKHQDLNKQIFQLQEWNKIKKASDGQILIKEVGTQERLVIQRGRNMSM